MKDQVYIDEDGRIKWVDQNWDADQGLLKNTRTIKTDDSIYDQIKLSDLRQGDTSIFIVPFDDTEIEVDEQGRVKEGKE